MAVPNELVMTEAGTSDVNTIYTRGEDVNGMPAWYSDNSLSLQLNDTWVIKDIETGTVYYKSLNYSPEWEAVEGVNPGPVVTGGNQ